MRGASPRAICKCIAGARICDVGDGKKASLIQARIRGHVADLCGFARIPGIQGGMWRPRSILFFAVRETRQA
ncbi:MAG: hypothetical protein ACP5NN_11030 [Methanolinea sp.]